MVVVVRGGEAGGPSAGQSGLEEVVVILRQRAKLPVVVVQG